jgi:hypothetical protein
MRPGERVRIIQDVLSALASRPYSQIELLFEEFGVPTYYRDEDGHDDITYCTQQLQRSGDEAIASLREFLIGEDALPSGSLTAEGDGLWETQPARAFLSHIYDHREFVADVKDSLKAYGIAGFVAHADINPSKDWRSSIKAGLATCDIFVPFVDDGFHQSQWCDQEVGWALARGVPILPVRPVGFERSLATDGFLEEFQDVCLGQGTGNLLPRWTASKIFDGLLSHTKTREVGVKALAEAFVNSRSFNQTRRLWELIERQPLIEGPQLRRLEYAVGSNRQVYEAVDPVGNKITELVSALVEKFEPPSKGYGYTEEPF